MEILAEFFVNVWHFLGSADSYDGLSVSEKKEQMITLMTFSLISMGLLVWATKRVRAESMLAKACVYSLAISGIVNTWVAYQGWVLASKLIPLLVLLLAPHVFITLVKSQKRKLNSLKKMQ